MATYVIRNGELYHYGVPGMKWGVRKAADLARRTGKFLMTTADRVSTAAGQKTTTRDRGSGKTTDNTQNADPHRARVEKAKRAVKVGAVVVGAALAVYGAKKLNDAINSFNYEQGLRAIERIQRAHDLSYQRYWLSQQR